MRSLNRAIFCLAATALVTFAGPVEFGMAEVQRAMAERGLRPGQIRFSTEITSDAAETYRILPGLITGGDLRGLMYGLLEAAGQIRATGRLTLAKGTPATPIRGIRYFLHNQDLEADWYYSRDYWREYFQMLARNRYNRFNLVFAHQTNYLAPPYPFWVAVPEFPRIRVPGLSDAQREKNFEMLRFISDTAVEHGIDFTLGIWEHNIQPRMTPTVEGLTPANIGPYSYAALKKVLAGCPKIRSVQMRTNAESGIPAQRQLEFYSKYVFRAIAEAGRRVTLDLRGWIVGTGIFDAALGSGAPVRLSSKYWGEFLGRPYQPADTWPNYSYLNFLEKPRKYDFYWEVWALGSNRILLWGDPGFVRRMTPTFRLSGSSGFEIDPPLAQKGFGNRPGKWGIFAEAARDRVFWKHEFERYWMFYMLWGRLSYDPKTPDKVWLAEFRRRFGGAAQEVFDAYRQASRMLPELVAVFLADPNMYIWPEVNPGGLIEDYKDILPSDWRYIAGAREAVENRLRGHASAKQTPVQSAAKFQEIAAGIDQALARARAKVAPGDKEWRSTEADFQVLSLLARYHARKQTAADHLAYFYETGDPSGLQAAKRELRAGLGIWEKLVALTDGLYPHQMSFGPADIGRWRDKLPYVRHDLKLIEERERIFERFGRFEFGFDFGGPVAVREGAAFHSTPYVFENTVEPRFRAVDPETGYTEARGYGWAGEGVREAKPLPLTPYAEVRAVAQAPQQLPANALFGDSIRGQGRQVFRVRTGPGDFTVLFLHPDGNATTHRARAPGAVLDIAFPGGSWEFSGLIVKSARAAEPPAPEKWPRTLPRPAILHTPFKSVAANSPLPLAIRIYPVANVKGIRLHYRAVNQLAKFKTLETTPAKPSFVIPAADVSPRWDLMYYFEVLNKENGGWFDPDPEVATPYYVVKVEDAVR